VAAEKLRNEFEPNAVIERNLQYTNSDVNLKRLQEQVERYSGDAIQERSLEPTQLEGRLGMRTAL
jgi:hypothetical protein